MKKITLFLLITLGYSAIGFAQEDDKVKGDRNVTIKQTYVDNFNTIVVGEDFEVELYYNSKPSVEIETDDNLHEYITIEVVDSVLTFRTTKDIRSKKEMKIKVNYSTGFSHIETHDNAEIRSLTSLELNDASLRVTGSSRAYLNIKAKNFKFNSLDKAKVKLNVSATKAIIELSDNCKLDALVNSKETKIDLYQRANIDIEGTTDNLRLFADNNAQFNGKNFTSKICNAVCEFASDAYIEATDSITIEASGSSEIYLFANPKITINRFLDTAKLQKKEK
ncbi:GIN domain-containing protein [Psychroserpens mesophilus]|uniref:GIN domain-containing protein n=1 Tax=Psychroserpens mesophilus TaxID=325473 RepID=UPI003D66167E